MATEFVILHAEDGIYLGHCMGLGFFSKLDCAGQPMAATFPTERAARAHVMSWDGEHNPDAFEYHPVAISQPGYASVPDLIKAGLREHIGREMLTAHLELADNLATA